jgi:hypothetical protein
MFLKCGAVIRQEIGVHSAALMVRVITNLEIRFVEKTNRERRVPRASGFSQKAKRAHPALRLGFRLRRRGDGGQSGGARAPVDAVQSRPASRRMIRISRTSPRPLLG